MREARAALEVDLDLQRKNNQKLSDELAAATAKHAQSLMEKDREVSELRADLKLRVFELSTLGVSLEVPEPVPCDLLNLMTYLLTNSLTYLLIY